ncbi:MAG TPA: 4a-hydroxytetrahydrobiopterin dehydratase [Thermoanaerobaculia bacterium]|nr:4a-hydroxytetrahydrobiopterin dehydratase [Thermoanaerobaculia bacterium]
MTKTSPRKKTARARRRADEPLSPRQLARRLSTLPGWEAEGGNRELVGRYTLGTTPSAVFAAMLVLFTADSLRRELRVEISGLRLTLRLSTPAVGAVTRADVELAALLARGPMSLPNFETRILAMLAATGIWNDRT